MGLYEFLRNSKLDSRSYFAATRPAFKFNQFGFTLGGPIQIPKIYNGKNRTFFFFNYEGFQQRRAATQVVTIPNEAWKRGDLSLNLDGRTPLPPIYDPYTERQTGVNAQGQPIYTRDRFPNNQIPVGRFPAYINTYLNLWFPSTLTPMNLNNTGNYINSTRSAREDNQTHARIDHKIADKNNLFGRVSWSDIYQRDPQNLPNAYQRTYNKYLGVTVSDTHIFSPSMILDVRFGYLRANLGQGPIHQFIDAYRAAGLTNVPRKFRDFDFPVNFNVTGVTQPGNGNLVNGPDFTYQGSLALTKITGIHSIAFGYDYTKLRTIHDSVFLNFDFNNQPTADPQNLAATGFPFASLLLGLPSGGGRISGEADLDIDQQLHHLWFQDDIKVSSKLTLNLGLRYEYNQWPHHRRGRMGGFDMTAGHFYWVSRNPITGEPANAIPRRSPSPKRKNFAPRIGLAYRITPEDRDPQRVRDFLQFEFRLGMVNRPRQLAVFDLGQRDGREHSRRCSDARGPAVRVLRSQDRQADRAAHDLPRPGDALHAELEFRHRAPVDSVPAPRDQLSGGQGNAPLELPERQRSAARTGRPQSPPALSRGRRPQRLEDDCDIKIQCADRKGRRAVLEGPDFRGVLRIPEEHRPQFRIWRHLAAGQSEHSRFHGAFGVRPDARVQHGL